MLLSSEHQMDLDSIIIYLNACEGGYLCQANKNTGIYLILSL